MRRERIVLHEIIHACDRSTELGLRISDRSGEATPDERDALLWNLSVIGEAITQLDPDFRSRHGSIPWQQPVRTRNRIVHGYWSLHMAVLVETACTDVPRLRADVAALASEMGA